jgi:HK97 family phage portal protein
MPSEATTMTDRPGWLGRIVARLTRHADDVQPGRIRVVRRTQAGEWVDPESALKTATVWACIRYLTNAVAQLPWRVMREEPDGDHVPAPRHPVDWLLNRRPNPEMGAFTFRQTMLGNALRYGNGYAEIERDNANRPVALWPLHPLRVTPRRRLENGALYYDIQGEGVGQRVELAPSEVFHLRGFGDGPVGYNVVEYAAQSIGWAAATETFGASFFGEGMHPAGFIEGANALTAEGKKSLREQLRQMFQGPRKAHRVALLDAGMKWSKLSVQPEEAQFIETRQHQVEEICRWFGVPPHKVMHLLRATFSNIEHQSIEVVTDSVVPWVRVFEDEADAKLFGQNRMGLFSQMDLSALLRGDMKAQADYFATLTQNGIVNRDEARAKLGMNRMPGGQGRKFTAQVNLTTLERIGEEPIKQGGEEPAKAAPSQQEPAGDPPAPGDDQVENVIH